MIATHTEFVAPDSRSDYVAPELPVAQEQDYVSHLQVIERAITQVVRRHHISETDAGDFAGVVRLHLIEDDYAVLRRFEGRSSLHTYLLVVITRVFQDWRNAKWGKWRPSSEAKRLGPLAVQLETLLVRDRHSMDEACEILRTRSGVTVGRAALEQLADRFPPRPRRSFVSADELEAHPATSGRPDSGLQAREAAGIARATLTALNWALPTLSPQDQLIVRLRFVEGRSVVDIARLLNLEWKPLYRRIENLLERLRVALESQGFSAPVVTDALEGGGFEIVADEISSPPTDLSGGRR